MDQRKRRRIVWISLGTLAALLLAGAAAWRYFTLPTHKPWQHLAHVVQLEQGADDPNSVQFLATSLAILGRDDDVRRTDFVPNYERPRSAIAVDQLELSVVPWNEAVARIAAEHRIVMIMESHFVTKHREFIGATLPTFADAGFTHYAAEAISPLDASLAARGYPVSETGLYTSDPRFGNVLRRALDLEFTVLGYDFRPFTHEGREEYAAATLAELFEHNDETKLVVHAGFSHVLKYETDHGSRWLAARLWEKTGIEPFTIWQWSSGRDSQDYDLVVEALEVRGVNLDEPVLLMPPPPSDTGLQDAPYGLARVDAIVIHPPDESVAPAKRTVLFPEGMQRIVGRWSGGQWPVVVSAYQRGEPVNAVPRDQVMLRRDETEFVLWIPDGAEYEIRAFDANGSIEARVERTGEAVEVGR